MPPPKTVREAAELFLEVMYFGQKRHMEEAAGEIGLTPPLAGTLWHLKPDQPMSMGALAEVMRCDASNITSIVDKLETRGFVRRQALESDRRVKLLALTEEGVKARTEFLDSARQPAPWLLALSGADQITLRDILRRAVDTLPKRDAADD